MTEKKQVCAQCGATLIDGMKFCEQCGAAVSPSRQTSPPRQRPPGDYLMEWVAPLPFWHNTVVIQQLSLVFVIPLAFLFGLLVVIDWPLSREELQRDATFVLLIAAIFLALMVIGIAVTFAGGYEMEYRLNGRGIGGRPYGRTSRKNAIVNFLLMISGRPTAMGAGMAAESRQVEYTTWKDVERVETDPRRRLITLKKGRRPLMVVACDDAHYDAVLQFAQEKAARARQRAANRK